MEINLKKAAIIAAAILIVVTSCFALYRMVFPTINTKPVDTQISQMKEDLKTEVKKVDDLKQNSEQKTVVIRETVKESIKTLSPNDVSKNILSELSMGVNP